MTKRTRETTPAIRIDDLITPGYGWEVADGAPTMVNPVDRARLITKVYKDFGIFSDEYAEQAPERLASKIERLTQGYQGTPLEPFEVVNLTQAYDCTALISAFNQGQRRIDTETKVDNIWSRYDLENLNRRTIDGEEPSQGDVRAHILFPQLGSYGRAGLNSLYANREKMRGFVKDKTLLNVTDYVLLQAMRREEGSTLMDIGTSSHFVQMDEKEAGCNMMVVGGVRVKFGTVLELTKSIGGAPYAFDAYGGVRFSAGE